MQIHKKDIVWPEAGVVRKRGRERVETEGEKRRKQSHWISSLQLCNFIKIFLKMTKKGSVNI